MNNVFEFKSALIGEYAKFSTSFAKPSAEDIVVRLEEEYESGRYWREPLIQINPNYEKDKTVDELAANGDQGKTAERSVNGRKDPESSGSSIHLYQRYTQTMQRKHPRFCRYSKAERQNTGVRHAVNSDQQK